MISHADSTHEELKTTNSCPVAPPNDEKSGSAQALGSSRPYACGLDEQVTQRHPNRSGAASGKPSSSTSPDDDNDDKYATPAVNASHLPDNANEQIGEPDRRTEARATVRLTLGSLTTTIPFSQPWVACRTRGLSDDSSGSALFDNGSLGWALAKKGALLANQYVSSGVREELEEGVNILRIADRLLSENHPGKARCLNNLGLSLFHRFERLGDVADLDEAITAQQKAARLIPDSDTLQPAYLNNLGNSFRSRFERLGDVADLNKSLTVLKQSLRHSPDGDPDKFMYLNNLGSSLRDRFRHLGDIADIGDAIMAHQQAIHQIPDGCPEMPACLNNLGNSFHDRFERLGDIADLDEAVRAHQRAVSLTEDDHPYKHLYLTSLAASLTSQFDRLDDIARVGEAIKAQQQALRLIPNGHPRIPAYLNSLGCCFQGRFDRLGDVTDLDEALSAHQQAVRLAEDGHPEKPMYLSNLGYCFQIRFERLYDIADIYEAIMAEQQSVRLTPDTHPQKPIRLNNLGSSFCRRFERLGDIPDIDEAITALQQAVRLTPDDHRAKPKYLNNLGISFKRRCERLDDIADANRAITPLQMALSLTPNGHPNKPARLDHLGSCLRQRFEYLRDVADLDEAIRAQQGAVRLTPNDHPHKTIRLHNLGVSFLDRFKWLGNVADLDEANSSHQQAVHLTPDDHPHKPICLNGFGNSSLRRFKRLGDVVDLDDAITVGQQAVHLTPDGHPNKSIYLNNLGASFCARLEHRHDDATLAQAINVYSQSARSSSGPPIHCFSAARLWGSLSDLGNSNDILVSYSTLISLLPRVVWLGRSVEQRYQSVVRIGDAVAEAAAAAISLGEPDLALEWLEQGRSIVWGQILQLRTPLDNLRQHYPHEADTLHTISRMLESAGTAQNLELSSIGPSQTLEEVARAHRRHADEYERLLKHIRDLPDFSDFLLPQKSASLCHAAVSGPIVVVNTYKNRCDALILLPNSSRVLHVSLPELQVSEMQLRLGTLTSGIRTAERACGPYEGATLPRWDEEMPEILRQLWLYIAEPVLRYLKLLQKPVADRMPHITWCLTGRLTFLPIHAAGLYGDRDQPKNFDYVVSSYTPTLTTLLSARRAPTRRCDGPQLLAVSQPEARMQKPLPGTTREVNVIRSLQNQTSRLRVTSLNGEEATAGAVVQCMTSCNWIHLACHGIQDPARPTNSAFLINGQLTLNEIMKQSLAQAELAFLSACQTAKGDSELPEEAIHLAAGMLMAGYCSVVGTMWSIRDDDAPIVAEKFYAYLMDEAGGDGTKAAYALHRAVGHLRDSGEGCGFDRWVPFIHLGICSLSEPSISS